MSKKLTEAFRRLGRSKAKKEVDLTFVSSTALTEDAPHVDEASSSLEIGKADGPQKVEEQTVSAVSDPTVGISTLHQNPRIVASYDKLQAAATRLSTAFGEYSKKHPELSPLTLDSVTSVLATSESRDNASVVGDAFGCAVEQILVVQTKQKKSVAHKVGSYLAKVYPLAKLTLNLASFGIQASPAAPFKTLIDGTSALLSIINQERTRAEDFIKNLEKISYQALRIGEVQKHHGDDISDLLVEKSTDLMTAIMNFLHASLVYFLHGFAFNLGKSLIGSSNYADAKEFLDNAIAEYDQALLLQVATSVLSATVARPSPAIENEAQGVISWLEPSLWEVDAQLYRNRSLRAPGTLQWVVDMEEFRRWRVADDRHYSCLWINGLPGVGKSIISAFLIDLLKAQNPESVVSYFFCKGEEPKLEDPYNVIRSIAAQLFISDVKAKRRFTKLKEESFSLMADFAFVFKELIRTTISEMGRNVYIVLDGLDECTPESANPTGTCAVESLLSCFTKLDCRIIVLSRSTPSINRVLGRYPTRTIGFEQSGYDIDIYVRFRLSQSPTLQKGFESLGEKDGSSVVRRAKGNFLWVSTVMDLLERSSSTKAFKAALETLPSEIGSLYNKVLDRIATSGSLDRAFALLEWILYSKEQLDLESLEIAAGLSSGEIFLNFGHFLRADCGSFISLVQTGSKGRYSAQILHETFRAYITSPQSSHRYINAAIAHANMATACLSALTKAVQASADFQTYASKYWVDHVRECTPTCTQAPFVFQALHKFFVGASLGDWFKDVAYQRFPHYDMGRYLLSVHDDMLNWIVSIPPDLVEASRGGSALEWRDNIVSDHSIFSRLFGSTLASVWINTAWTKFDLTTLVLVSTLNICRILNLLDITDSALDSTHGSPGHKENQTRPMVAFNFDSVTRADLTKTAELAGFDPLSGVHQGNLAQGGLTLYPEGCMDHFEKAVDEDPSNSVYYQGMAVFCRLENRIEEALSHYETALEHDSTIPPDCSTDYWPLLAQYRKEHGDIDGAIQAFHDGIAQGNGQHDWYYLDGIARIYEAQSNFKAVKETYQDAISQATFVQAQYRDRFTDACSKIGDWQAQINIWLEAIEMDPGNVYDYRQKLMSRAAAYRSAQQWDVVEEIINQALNGDPAGEHMYLAERVHYNLALRQWSAALEDLEYLAGAISTNSLFDMWIQLGDAYTGLNQDEKASEAYKKWLDQAPSAYGATHKLGLSYLHLKKYSLAIKTLNNALKQLKGRDLGTRSAAIDEAEIEEDIGTAFSKKGQQANALAHFHKAVEMYRNAFAIPFEPFEQGSLWRYQARDHHRFGRLLESLERLSEAQEQYEEAVKIFDTTTHVEDDELEISEYQEAVDNRNRLSTTPILGVVLAPETIQFWKERDLALSRRTNWGVDKDSVAPRTRPLF